MLSKHSFIPKEVQLSNGFKSHLHSSLQNDHMFHNVKQMAFSLTFFSIF